jgi:hypothetical protein
VGVSSAEDLAAFKENATPGTPIFYPTVGFKPVNQAACHIKG